MKILSDRVYDYVKGVITSQPNPKLAIRELARHFNLPLHKASVLYVEVKNYKKEK